MHVPSSMSKFAISLARPLLTFALAYLNYLASRAPPAPPKNRAKYMDSRKDVLFVSVASVAVQLSQAVLTLASLTELVVVATKYTNDVNSNTISSLLVQGSHPSIAVSKIGFTGLALIGWLSGTAGSLLRYWAIKSLGNRFTFQLVVRDDHKIITTGPYAFVRHPGYAGSIVSSIGTSLYFLGPGSYAYECGAWKTAMGMLCIAVWMAWKMFMVGNLLRRTQREDAFLRKDFGREWVLWKNKVQYKLIPGIY